MSLSRRSSYFLILFLCCLSLPLGAKTKQETPNVGDPVQALNALIWSGEYEPALRLLQSSSDKKSKGTWKERWAFWQAYLQWKAGKAEEAAKLFEKLAPEYQVIQDYVNFYWALALRDSGKATQAIDKLQHLKDSPSAAPLKPRLDREIALAYCKAGDRAQGVDRLNQLIQTESSEIRTYHLRFDRAQCLIELGDKDEAQASLKTLYLNYPEGDLSDLILKSFEKIGRSKTITADDHIARANHLMDIKRPDLAAIDLTEAAKDLNGGSLNFKQEYADALFKARRYPEAAQVYDELARSSPNALDSEQMENWAKAYSRSDQFQKAIKVYEDLLASGGEAKRSTFLYKIAFLTMDKGDLQEANKKFEALLAAYPKHGQREQIEWYLAWNNYLLGNYSDALSRLDRLDQTYGQTKLTQRIPYWRARILEKSGKKDEAKSAYQALAYDKSFSYYGLLSLKRLQNNLKPEVPPKRTSLEELPQLKIPATFSLAQAEGGDGKNRLRELLLTGLWEDFLNELKDATAGESVPASFFELKRNVEAPDSESFSDQGSWDRRYPAAYPTLISFFTQTRKIPMALAWAIMREESGFRPGIVSPAQAIGLMQIIPPTGFQIARELGRASFIPDDLYQPVTNIEFGVQYLATNSRHFPSIIHTIASYNAGPEAVDRWTKAHPSMDWDEFVEEIPYAETNTYVKKVLKSYYLYSLIYPGSGPS